VLDMTDAVRSEALSSLLTSTANIPPDQLDRVVSLTARALGATAARVLIADYAQICLQELGVDGPTGAHQALDGTLAGRAFVRNEIVVSPEDPTFICVPLEDQGERLGVLELSHPNWTDDVRATLDPIVRVLVLVLISKRRFTDIVLRSRRAQPLALAAEMQWDLLPPPTCSTEVVSMSGVLEPAYTIGGDAFDFAVNPNRVEFAIVDAVGHGLAAVSMSISAVNSLRNARREGAGIETAYYDTGAVIRAQFGQSYFVTGQIGALALDTGVLTWLNAGHPLPLLVRDKSYVGELACAPSLPMGLGGSVAEIATAQLQPGDRVLFFTDGVSEAKSPDGEQFGVPRLADLLVRATLDSVSPAETARRLSNSIVTFNSAGLNDDATLLLVDYHGNQGRH
jgi:serine phosphatase RsbU (regulator of sigma subunit)